MRKASAFCLKLVMLTVACSVMNVGASTLKVCSVLQAYSALEGIKEISSVKFETHYLQADEMYSALANHQLTCDLVISSEEKLPILLVRSNLASADKFKALVKAPLILWTADPYLLKNTVTPIVNKRLRSLSLPKKELTPVGYAASVIVSKNNFPTDYLSGKIYRTSHEYQTFSMVLSGNVQAGFITKPLIMKDGHPQGSYWVIPPEEYPAIYYYLQELSGTKNHAQADALYRFFSESPKVLQYFYAAGFAPL